jgi:hypothetical protein
LLRFFTNRQLSAKLLIPLAKWKRWAREFLPPDPLGGLQSGVARRYSVDQALTVYIGGHLVTELKTSISEARQILADLHACLKSIGAFANTRIDRRYRPGRGGSVSAYSIIICRSSTSSGRMSAFCYTVRGLISRENITVEDQRVLQEEFIEVNIPASTQAGLCIYRSNICILPISAIVDQFARATNTERRHFTILDQYHTGG